jgi:hypothetical protein
VLRTLAIVTRMVCGQHTRVYIDLRMTEGRTKKVAIRRLKRYIAREITNNSHASQALDIPRSIVRWQVANPLGPSSQSFGLEGLPVASRPAS